MLKQGRNTQKKSSRIMPPGLTYGSQHLERQTLKPVLREEPIGPEPQLAFTDCLESCTRNSFPTKSHPNQPRQTQSDCLKLGKGLTESPNPMLFTMSTQTSPIVPSELILMTGVISRVVTPKDKAKSNPLLRQKGRIFSESVVTFQSFPVSLKGGSFRS